MACVCTFWLHLVESAGSSVLWRPQIVMQISEDCSLWHFAMRFGAFVGFAFMLLFICVFVPILIVTWTTALVLRCLFGQRIGRRHAFLLDGQHMAMDMILGAAIRVVREGTIMALITGLWCFLSSKTFYRRGMYVSKVQ